MEQSPSLAKRRGSWDALVDIAAEMVNNLELRDTNNISGGPAYYPSARTKESRGLPSLHGQSDVAMKAKRRGSGAFMDMLFTGDDYDYVDPTIDLKAQARQQSTRQPKMFSSVNLPRRKRQVAKDPLMDFHERYNKAQDEYRRQQDAEMRRQQVRDLDEEKSIASSNSFFDFLTKAGAADELMADGKSQGGGGVNGGGGGGGGGASGGMKRSTSSHSMSSLFSLFGDTAEEINRLTSAAKPVNKPEEAEKKEDPTLHAAVKQSKSVKGNRVYNRGKEAAERGDWKKAVAYYHIALVKQREFYGEDHIVTANTLNSLGVALMNLGEHFGALTALEEALQIRQEVLGAGAEEVAITTTNIWMVLKASQENEERPDT